MLRTMPPLSRRHFCHLALALLAARPCFSARAARRWLAPLARLCRDLKAGDLTAEAWQDGIAKLWAGTDLTDLLRDVDLDRLLTGVDLPENMAGVRDVPLPALRGLPLRFGHKIFALRRGAAVVPHAHNNMASAHLVVQGTFHVRTFQRLRDEDGALILTPSIDRTFRAGEALTMSDTRDNVHWLVATSERACTFDTPVSELVKGKSYKTPANEWGMIHVDPTGKPGADGTVRAPVITFEEAIRRFGKS
jgi:hypothetical protein